MKESVIQAPCKVAANERGSNNKGETAEDRGAEAEPRNPYRRQCASRSSQERAAEDKQIYEKTGDAKKT
jgi:hypothetical protein